MKKGFRGLSAFPNTKRIFRLDKKLIAAVVLLIIGLVVSSCSGEAGGDEAPSGRSSETASANSDTSWNDSDAVTGATDYAPLVSSAVPVEKAALRSKVVGSGIISGQQEAAIRAKNAGDIKKISFELGDELSEGQVLLTLDDTIAELNVLQLEQQYETAEADLASKEETYERGSLSASQLTQARASLNGLEAQLAQAREALRNTRITTPIKGRVAQKSPDLVIGDQVQPGQQLARVVDLENLRIRLSLGQDQILLVREGYEAEIRIDTPKTAFTAQGVVKAISAGSDTRTGSWTVLVDFPNPAPEILKAGMSAEVIIFNRDAEMYTVVPGASIVYRNGKTYVFIVEDETARIVEIEIIDRYGNLTAVEPLESDLNLLDYSVLVSGLSRVQSGDAAVSGAPTVDTAETRGSGMRAGSDAEDSVNAAVSTASE
ncbi:MAG: efflux RND transporter periplasmic adaptor subunit [Spirochaetia bacterium]|nr:efflux RND transporter periplasmic adaptor subunit [Spirochaetia bacterium]